MKRDELKNPALSTGIYVIPETISVSILGHDLSSCNIGTFFVIGLGASFNGGTLY